VQLEMSGRQVPPRRQPADNAAAGTGLSRGAFSRILACQIRSVQFNLISVCGVSAEGNASARQNCNLEAAIIAPKNWANED